MKGGMKGSLALCIVLALAAVATGANINGEWTDPSVNSRAIITQRGNQVDITNSFLWHGKTVEWQARGEMRGSALNLKYWYTLNQPAGWGPGTMELRLVDSRTLAGRWVSETRKYQQIITFKFVRHQTRPAPGRDEEER